ncbi:hypothetical protein ACIPZG_24755 [Pseudomonas sp. NPDC089395]|uniref:hypothetical protein n=1 Tax=Pseudomonas sp. NPDC089395 TaxID=3364460 RepID=UPI0038200E89
MNNSALVVAFGLAVIMASTISGYCAYETSQIVRKGYYMDSEAAEPTHGFEFTADSVEEKR